MRLLLFLQYPLVNHLGAFLESDEIRLLSLALVILGIALPRLMPSTLLLVASTLRGWLMLLGSWSVLLIVSYLNLIHWLYLLLPGLIPLTFGIVFGASLRTGAEPLVTRIGEQARGPLTMEMRRYTRTVTLLWTAVFMLLTLQAIVLMTLKFTDQGSLVVESWLLNVVSPVCIGALFVGEFWFRKRRFPRHDHPTFWNYLAIVRRAF